MRCDSTSLASPFPQLIAGDVARGVCRLLFNLDLMPLCEVPLGNGRRADVLALGPDGRITLVEIKVSLADLRGDLKWPEYLDFCDRYFWAVPSGFRTDELDREDFRPDRTGLIVADQYGAAVLREAEWRPLNAARRKSEQLRFARRAARRLIGLNDPGLENHPGSRR
jgi:hypothetical protein